MHLIRTFGREAAEVSRARRFVADALERSGREATDDVMLVTSELVSNAVVHGDDPVEVHVELDEDRVHLEVHDAGSARVDLAGMPTTRAHGGRGLPLVAAVTRAFGTGLDHRGYTTVWADLAVPPLTGPRA